jgi:hypothetical protein
MAVYQELVGKTAITTRDMALDNGTICPAGTKVIIKKAYYGMVVEGEPCPVCGTRFYITGLKKGDLKIL